MVDSNILTNSTTRQESPAKRWPVVKPPPTAEEIDRLNYHNGLQKFGEALEEAAKAVLSNHAKSRYRNVHVLFLSWEDEDPQLPVSLEISKLFDVFVNIYHFQAEILHIPNQNSHNKVSKKILEFVGEDDTDDMKIVYYAGHGRLTQNRLLSWTSWRNDQGPKCPTVAWSGIQNILEQAQSDVLILLDCCASGTVNTDNGQGVTEIISACSFNSIANGVGQYSFTKELTIELENLSTAASFTTEQLYNNIYRRIQARMPEEGKERHPAPIRLVLTNETPRPRSLQLSKMANPLETKDLKKILRDDKGPRPNAFSNDESVYQTAQAQQYRPPMCSLTNTAGSSKTSTAISIRPNSYPAKLPTLSLAFRFHENLRVCDLSTNSFTEWIRNIPAAAEELKVAAGVEETSITETQNPEAFYSYMFEKDKRPTRMLERILEGIGDYIINHIVNTSDKSLSPFKLASFYKSVGGNYDSLFVDVPYPSISWIWASLGCKHILLPSHDRFKPPSIPALTKPGFVRWQAIQILLEPEEHVPFMQTALRNFPIKDPDTKVLFPKDLPAEVFPLVPDVGVAKWHGDCADKLRQIASTETEERPHIPRGSRRSSFQRSKLRPRPSLPTRRPPKRSSGSRNLRQDFDANLSSSTTASSDSDVQEPHPLQRPLVPASEPDQPFMQSLRSYLQEILSEDGPLISHYDSSRLRWPTHSTSHHTELADREPITTPGTAISQNGPNSRI